MVHGWISPQLALESTMICHRFIQGVNMKVGLRLFIVAMIFLGSVAAIAQDSCIKPVKAFPLLPALASPLALEQAGDDASFWFAALRDGQIVSFANRRDVDRYQVVLDIREKVNNQVEMGLTDIAFHPNFPADNRLFLIYSDSSQKNRTTLASFKVDVETRVIDPASEQVLLTLNKNALFHVAGNVVFGLDGYLYAGFGDDGYTPHFAQYRKNLHGSIIRIDVNAEPYAVPDDNPFNHGQKLCRKGVSNKVCPEIYAYGFRNPWRFSFDKATRRLWEGDLGEDRFEEINIVEAGGNYGWPKKEGTACYAARFCFDRGLRAPHNTYDLAGPQSIVGGYVYRGADIASLYGQYLFGDIYSQNFFTIDADSQPNQAFKPAFNAGFMVASMAQGSDGEIYLLNFGGVDKGDSIYAIVEASCGAELVSE